MNSYEESNEDALPQSAEKQNTPQSNYKTSLKGREYQRRYYERNKAKLREYQDKYRREHHKKQKGRGKRNPPAPREVIRVTFNVSDIQQTPSPEKMQRMLEQIISGERFFHK